MLKESIANFRSPVYVSTQRSIETYQATQAYTETKLTQLVTMYNTTRNDQQTLRLIRKDITDTLRGYHVYCIKQNIGAHYIEVGLDGNGIFEHMIPANAVRDLLIAGVLTVTQACNVPTCRLSKQQDDLLREAGWQNKTPDFYYFWKRYQFCFDTTNMFTTWDGNEVDTTASLDEHFARFC